MNSIFFVQAGYMKNFQRKAFVLSLVLFVLSFAVYAADNKGDDIFESQKVEEGDFYKIVVEPSKKEIETENSKFFESVKQKKLDILKKIENERQKVASSKSQISSAKERARAELEKNKANLKNKPAKNTAKTKTENNATASTAQAKKEDVSVSQTPRTDPKKKTAEKEIFEKQNKTAKKPESDSKRKTPVNKPGIKENEQKKLREQQNENNKTMTIEESEQKMDSVIDMRKKFIDFGMGYKGINYVWGGKTPRPGFDCSGLVSYTAKQSLGIDVRGNAQDIYNQTSPVSLGEALPGDLIFFKGASDSRITHVGIYLGKNPGQNDFGKQNLFLNAASGGPRTGVIISGLNENYWKKTFYGCGRLIPEI